MTAQHKIESGDTPAAHERTSPLSPRAVELLQERANSLPIWVRAPKTGVEFYSGLSRAKLYELASAGKIVSRSIREPGQVKGTRLFLLSSILDFISACDEGKPQKQKLVGESVT